MGNLLKILAKDESASKIDIFLDFENAQPTHPEFEVWQIVNSVLVHSDRVLEDLQKYRGAGEEIRQAISNPSHDQLQQIAWNAVVPLVAKLKGYYDYSLNLGKYKYYKKIVLHDFERSHILIKLPTKLTVMANQVKLPTNLTVMTNQNGDDGSDVNNEMANRMSLFYAQATPMLKMLSDATTRFVSENKNLPIENTTDLLSTMAAVCKTMLEHDAHYTRFKNEDTVLFCLRVMVGVIILYDHVHPVGAFDKKSSIDIKGCIKVLKVQHPTKVEGLLNALRYTSKHFNDDSTPKNIKAMLS
uniref:Protein FAM49B-like n=1 Tax=Saccoglossus kowalevskii TaxID=10224 RepID=A0ABM0MJK7_SACKO|nr:PREDICTED: protein FAM49B-like [Saccoglossus kowalevskii]